MARPEVIPTRRIAVMRAAAVPLSPTSTELIVASAMGAITRPKPRPVSTRGTVMAGSDTSSPQPLMRKKPTAASPSPVIVGIRKSIRWQAMPPSTAPMGMAAVSRISRSPPSRGAWPSTVLAMRGMVTIPMISAPPTSRCVELAALNAQALNIDGGSRGSTATLCLRMKRSSETMEPTSRAAMRGSGSPTRANPSVSVTRLRVINAPPR